MDAQTAIRRVFTREMLTTAIGLVTVSFALYFALSKGLVLILFFGISTAFFVLLLVNQLRRSIYRIRLG